MKKVIVLIFMFLGALAANAQIQVPAAKIYNPEADAKADLDKAVGQALKESKNVLIQVGGNWCPWCLRLHKFIDADADIKKVIQDNYVFLLVNYSKENKNEAVLESLGFPQRFGFPVFVVLNSARKVIHIQDSGYLESEKTYSKEKLIRFFKLWTPAACSGIKE